MGTPSASTPHLDQYSFKSRKPGMSIKTLIRREIPAPPVNFSSSAFWTFGCRLEWYIWYLKSRIERKKWMRSLDVRFFLKFDSPSFIFTFRALYGQKRGRTKSKIIGFSEMVRTTSMKINQRSQFSVYKNFEKSTFLNFRFCASDILSWKSFEKFANTLIFMEIKRTTFEKPIIFNFVWFPFAWRWNLGNFIPKTILSKSKLITYDLTRSTSRRTFAFNRSYESSDRIMINFTSSHVLISQRSSLQIVLAWLEPSATRPIVSLFW